jgi:pSer/pThr/pTyr-binding forkhead associated (FHA) protein
MKLSLTVLSAGAMQGKAIAITLSEFLIGRGRECNLRPANPIISKRHCALISRDDKVFVRDFASTNGTYVNDVEIKDEVEIKNGDRLNVGPLAFRVCIEKDNAEVPVVKVEGPGVRGEGSETRVKESSVVPRSLPVPVTPHHSQEDEEAAALLLAMHDDATSTADDNGEREAPSLNGSTIVESPQNLETAQQSPLPTNAANRHDAAKAAAADTSAAAKVILEKYLRRPRM